VNHFLQMEAGMSLLPNEVESHYLQSREQERLGADRGELERLRTQAILARDLPSAPAVVVDVGGAAGVYAFPLARQGYQLHLIDAVELHLEQARAHAAASGVSLASIALGDARKLEFPAGNADAVSMLGPLYHLIERRDRVQALEEARRILKPGGVLFAAAISRFASLIDGLLNGFFRMPRSGKPLPTISPPASTAIRETILLTSRLPTFIAPRIWPVRFAKQVSRMPTSSPSKALPGVRRDSVTPGRIRRSVRN
jgi:SAM-dependent methyltransferase